MNYCSHCGSNNLQQSIPAGDNRPRFNCPDCENILYQNPRVITGYLPYFEDKVLLCKRAIEPRKGYWTLPAGFLENGESILAGAQRESDEEAGIDLNVHELYTVFNLIDINQIYVFYRGEIIDGKHAAGDESLETQLFLESEIPWGEIAFPAVTKTLKHFFSDRQENHYPLREEDLLWRKRTVKP